MTPLRLIRSSVVLVLCAFSLPVFSQYVISPCKQGLDLRLNVRSNYASTDDYSYDAARDRMYDRIDTVMVGGNRYTYCIYSDFRIAIPAGTTLSATSTVAYQNNTGINAEHVFPQSMGAGAEPAKSDLHNLFAAKVSINTERSNHPFGDVPDALTDYWYRESARLTVIPTTNIDEYSERDAIVGTDDVFEPKEASKGNIARALFYFFSIYPAADSAFFFPMTPTLLKWHYQDPADAKELDRNNRVKLLQGKDNPFILDSTLARRTYFMPSASYATGSASCFSLPVELLAFEGKLNSNNRAELTWTTLSERNNKGWTIERSANGFDFKEITFIDGAGDSETRREYNFFDPEELRATRYYRLRQVDFDGKVSFSNTISIDRTLTVLGMKVFPNPATDIVNIESLSQNLTDGDVTVTVTDILGRVVIQKNMAVQQGQTLIDSLDISALPSATYFISLQNGSRVTTEKLIKR
jgi:endonuclease I